MKRFEVILSDTAQTYIEADKFAIYENTVEFIKDKNIVAIFTINNIMGFKEKI